MYKNLFSTFLLLFFSLWGKSQIAFQKTYGGNDNDYGTSVQQTVDGGYIITGSTWSYGPGLEAIYLIKTNSTGDTLWTKIFGGAIGSGGLESVIQTSDGGYIIGSGTKSFGAGLQDVYIIKLDSNGNIQWTKTFGGTNPDVCVSIKQTTDGGYALLGWTQSFGAGNSDIYFIKTDVSGNDIWRKTYGGINFDIGTSIQQTADGGYIISARTNSFGAGNLDAYLIKTNSSGDTLWTKTYGGLNVDAAAFVQQTADGGYIISGYTESFGAGLYDSYLIKTDSIGNEAWSKTYGGTNNDALYAVHQTINNDYICVGYTQSFGGGMSDGYLIKTNSLGDTLFTQTFGGANNENSYFVDKTTDSGYIITGQMTVSSFQDVYLIKTDSLFNSACNNQYSTNTIIGNPATITTSPNTQILSPSGSSGTTATVVSIGAFVNSPCLSVGIDEMTDIETDKVFPNPFSNSATIQFNHQLKDSSLNLFNVTGERVKTINFSGESVKIERENLSEGIYYYQIIQENGNVLKGKLMIID